MDDLQVALRLVLMGVLVVAAAAKWADRAGTEQAARDLGVPPRLAGAARFVLPAVEVTLAAALLPARTSPWAAGATAALMGGFTLLVALNLIRGRRPSCHCFGAIDSGPIGLPTLVRNVGLTAAAVLVAWPGSSAGAIFTGGPVVEVVAFAGLLILGTGLGRQRALAPTDGAESDGQPLWHLAVGDVAPEFVLPDADGRPVSLSSLRARGVPVVLIFGNVGCATCASLVPDVETWQREHADRATVAFVVSATAESASAVRDQYRVDHLLVQEGREVTELFGQLPAPSALIVDPDGRIASPPVAGAGAVRELVDRLTGRAVTPYAPPPATSELLGGGGGLEVGDPAPDFRLPSLAGPVMTPLDLRTGPRVFVFVQDRCSQCGELLGALAGSRSLASRAVVVSAGGTLRVAAEHLSGPVLVDRLGLLPAAYGVTALPSAVVVDQQVVSSPMVAGVDAVLELLRGAQAEPIDVGEITDALVPRPHPGVVTLTLDGSTVVGDPITGIFNRLDANGRLLWSCFDGTESLAAIATGLSAELGAPPEAVRSDVLDFARRLGQAGALDGVRPRPPGSGTHPASADQPGIEPPADR